MRNARSGALAVKNDENFAPAPTATLQRPGSVP